MKILINFFIKHKKKLLIGFICTLFIFLIFIGPGNVAEDEHSSTNNAETIWTCAMHPQIHLNEPGNCPICFMELIPLETDDNSEGIRNLKLSKTAIELSKIKSVPVSYQFIEKELRLNGKIQIDETTLENISSRFKGRVERMYVNYEGVSLKKGDHVYEIYSPELYSAQEAYIKTYIASKNTITDKNTSWAGNEEKSMLAARDRLLLLGLKEYQVKYLERNLIAPKTISVFSEYNGVVINKLIEEGTYIQTGTILYKIADLKKIWIVFDAYETDLQWIRYGQEISISVDSFPGKEFTGRISYIDPFVDEQSRTVRVRVSLDNEYGLLKPGMLTSGIIHSKFTKDGQLIDSQMAGKWISPMHPEIIKDKPGYCDICKTPLIPVSEYGIIDTSTNDQMQLVIPVTAPLITGKRAIVYIEKIIDDEYIYEAREIVLGPKTKSHYIVEEGLEEGELIVYEGNFKIDAAMQIQAKPSMMSITKEDNDNQSSGGTR